MASFDDFADNLIALEIHQTVGDTLNYFH
jgi:hypothetical protein